MVNSLSLTFYDSSVHSDRVSIYTRSDQGAEWQAVDYELSTQGQHSSYRFRARTIEEMRFVYMDPKGESRLILSEVLLDWRLSLQDVEQFGGTAVFPGHDFTTLFDANPTTYLAPHDTENTRVIFRLKQATEVNALTLSLYNAKLYPASLLLYVKSSQEDNWDTIDYTLTKQGLDFVYHFVPRTVKEMKIVCDDCRGQPRLVVSELTLARRTSPQNIERFVETELSEDQDFNHLFDSDPTTYVAPTRGHYQKSVVTFRLKNPTEANMLALKLYNADLYPAKVSLYARATEASNWEKVDYDLGTRRLYFMYWFESRLIKEMKIVCDDCRGQPRLLLSELFLNWQREVPLEVFPYGSFTTEVFQIDGQYFDVRVDTRDIPHHDIVVLYRSGASEEAVSKGPWSMEILDPICGRPHLRRAAYYQFRVLFANHGRSSGWRNLRVRNLADNSSAVPPSSTCVSSQ